jgi:hypothetical protein
LRFTPHIGPMKPRVVDIANCQAAYRRLEAGDDGLLAL